MEFSTALHLSLGYAGVMSRVIRRTFTISITETLTIIWTPEDEAFRQQPTAFPKNAEEQNESMQISLDHLYLDRLNASDIDQ